MAKKNKTQKSKHHYQTADIIVTQNAVDTIRSESSKSGKKETGGLLLGEKKLVNNNYIIIVREATGPGSKSETGQHYYITDKKHMQNQLKKFLNPEMLKSY